jgi:hypothetical protein
LIGRVALLGRVVTRNQNEKGYSFSHQLNYFFENILCRAGGRKGKLTALCSGMKFCGPDIIGAERARTNIEKTIKSIEVDLVEMPCVVGDRV